MMQRRDFITLLGGAAATWPLAARAQQPAMPVIGYLGSESAAAYASRLRAFHQGLGEMGFVEGRNVAIEYRWAEDRNDALPALAADLLRHRVAVIAANGPAISIAKAATTTVPVVFQTGGDPIVSGYVASLSRPGGNLTGVTSLAGELGPKKLELLREVVPKATAFAALVNPSGPNFATGSKDFRDAAKALGFDLHLLNATTKGELEEAFATAVRLRLGGLVIVTDAFFNTQSEWLGELSARYAVPAIFQYREFVAAGGLLGYGGSLTEPSYKVGLYVGRILKGENPTDLPVQQATTVELFINLRAAKTMSLTVPLPLLGRADEVIE
jgi:putative ABC transport system substrate-binding protein